MWQALLAGVVAALGPALAKEECKPPLVFVGTPVAVQQVTDDDLRRILVSQPHMTPTRLLILKVSRELVHGGHPGGEHVGVWIPLSLNVATDGTRVVVRAAPHCAAVERGLKPSWVLGPQSDLATWPADWPFMPGGDDPANRHRTRVTVGGNDYLIDSDSWSFIADYGDIYPMR